VSAGTYMNDYALHPQGYAVALTTRGKPFTFGNWEGPVVQYGEQDGVRYRLLEWLNDGKRLVAVNDASGREALIVFNPDDASEKTYPDIEFGRATSLVVSPTDDVVALTNHRNELVVVDLEAGTSRVLDSTEYGNVGGLGGIAWSPDGRWLAYHYAISSQRVAIKLCNVESGETHQVTEPVRYDFSPAFDPDGKYLYFLGYRIYNPVYDSLQFDLSFPRGSKPYAILLRSDLRSPFIPEPKAPDDKEKEKEKDEKKSDDEANNSQETSEEKDGK